MIEEIEELSEETRATSDTQEVLLELNEVIQEGEQDEKPEDEDLDPEGEVVEEKKKPIKNVYKGPEKSHLHKAFEGGYKERERQAEKQAKE